MRRANRRTRVDATQTAIVEALRAAGAEVWIIGYPCDLLVFTKLIGCASKGEWFLLECKPEKRRRKDQPKQDEFLEQTGTPKVRTPEEALKAVGIL